LWDNGKKGKTQIKDPPFEADRGFDCIVLRDNLLDKKKARNNTIDILQRNKRYR